MTVWTLILCLTASYGQLTVVNIPNFPSETACENAGKSVNRQATPERKIYYCFEVIQQGAK